MKVDSVEYSGGDLCGFRYPILLNPWFLMAAAVFLGVLLSFTTVYLDDESIWGYCGWLWSAHGEPPYLRSFENKPAGIFLLYWLSNTLFVATVWPVRCLALAALAGILFMLFKIGSHYQSRVGGAMAALIFALFTLNNATDGAYVVTTEAFMLLFVATAVYLLSQLTHPTQKRWFYTLGSGLAFGAAMGFKQIAVLDIIGLIPLYLVAVRGNASVRIIMGDVLWMLLGCVAVTAIEFLPFARKRRLIARLLASRFCEFVLHAF